MRKFSGRGLLGLVSTALAIGAFGSSSAGAAVVPAGSLGVNVKVWYMDHQYQPTDLSLASGVGAGVARVEADQGTNMDGIVRWLAQSHVRLYPILGLPCPSGTTKCTNQTQIPPATATSEMSQYVAAFAKRYGPRGTFWAANPKLPYLPVLRFEIGNEPNIRTIWVQDGTHLHWPDPSNRFIADAAAYAEVYKASRAALHKVDPTGVAVVGGLADSASYGVDVKSDETLLDALPRGGVDAVGYHPWVFFVSDSLLKPDTAELRVWMEQHGFSGVPLDVNEFGACNKTPKTTDNSQCPVTQSSATWGSAVASYTSWALCASWLHVNTVQPFVWGATPISDRDVWLPLVASDGTETAYGKDFLGTAKKLTTSGCPKPPPSTDTAPKNSTRPAIHGAPVTGNRLTSSPGTWTGNPRPTLYYQWDSCDPAGRECTAIGGANSASYRLQSSDEWSRISLQVTVINPSGAASAASAVTAQVGRPPPGGSGAGAAGGSTAGTGTGGSGAGTGTGGPSIPAAPTVTGPPSDPGAASATGAPAIQVAVNAPTGKRSKRSMQLRVVRFSERGRRVSLSLRLARGSGTAVVSGATWHGRQRARRRFGRRWHGATTIAFSALLPLGTWTVTITAKPARGYAAPNIKRRIIIVERTRKP